MKASEYLYWIEPGSPSTSPYQIIAHGIKNNNLEDILLYALLDKIFDGKLSEAQCFLDYQLSHYVGNHLDFVDYIEYFMTTEKRLFKSVFEGNEVRVKGVLAWVEQNKKIERTILLPENESISGVKISRQETSALFFELRKAKLISNLSDNQLAKILSSLTGCSYQNFREELSYTTNPLIDKKHLESLLVSLETLILNLKSRINQKL